MDLSILEDFGLEKVNSSEGLHFFRGREQANLIFELCLHEDDRWVKVETLLDGKLIHSVSVEGLGGISLEETSQGPSLFFRFHRHQGEAVINQRLIFKSTPQGLRVEVT